MKMNELEITARKITCRFMQLTDEEISVYATLLRKIELKKGEILINQGEIAKGSYWVESGLLRQFYYKAGRDVTEHFACEGHGMMCIRSMFNCEPSDQIIEALEKSTVYYTPYKQLISLSEQHPAINTYIRRLLEFALMVSQIKADSWRFESARERYNRFMTDFPEVSKRASINHIASYLLMTPESLSRVRSGTL